MSYYSPQLGSTENWNFVPVVQVTVLSPLSSNPSLQLRDRTVPVETGNCLSVFMLFQVVFRPVQSEIFTLKPQPNTIFKFYKFHNLSKYIKPHTIVV